jgi:hypothetical protein
MSCQVDFEAVAQKVGIKYAKNARQSFRRVWDKMKGGAATANGNGTHAEDTNDGLEVDSPKKPAAKKAAAPKKAPGGLTKIIAMICPITDLASFSQEGRRQDHSSEEGF